MTATAATFRCLPVSPRRRRYPGAILLNSGHYLEAAGCIEAADFSLDSHRRIFLRMGELLIGGKGVDIVTLAEQLQRNKELSAIGGVAYLASLTEGSAETALNRRIRPHCAGQIPSAANDCGERPGGCPSWRSVRLRRRSAGRG